MVVALVEIALFADSGTTCTPSSIGVAEFDSGTGEGTDVGAPEDTAGETETELMLDVACAIRAAETSEPGVALAIVVVEEASVVVTVLPASAPVVVARTGLKVSLASAGTSSISGSLATNTKTTFCAPEMLPSDEFEGTAKLRGRS